MDTVSLPAPLTADEELELLASIARHPAGKRQNHLCPTCGQNPSGALGDPALSLPLAR